MQNFATSKTVQRKQSPMSEYSPNLVTLDWPARFFKEIIAAL
jgi:hypothetical protein